MNERTNDYPEDLSPPSSLLPHLTILFLVSFPPWMPLFLLFYLCISATSVLFSFPFPLEIEACFPSQILHPFLLVQTITLKVGEFLRPSIVSLLTLRSTLATTRRHSFYKVLHSNQIFLFILEFLS